MRHGVIQKQRQRQLEAATKGRETLSTNTIKGQSLSEITIIIAIAALVFIAMQVYMQRGIQGKTKFLTDYIIGNKQRAYTAETATSTAKTTLSGRTRVKTGPSGSTDKTIISETTITDSTSYAKDKIN